MYLLLQVMVTFNYSGVMNFCLMGSSQGYSIEEGFHHISVEVGSNLAQYIHHDVLASFLVLQLEVEPCKGSNPSVTISITVWCCHYVS